VKHRLNHLIIVSTLLLGFSNPAHALRCGKQLVNVGDLKHEVKLACGEPISKEVIGYIDKNVLGGDRIRVLKIEEWIILSDGYYYSLVFEGNRLKKIESAGDNK
jgi:hypothetical protein